MIRFLKRLTGKGQSGLEGDSLDLIVSASSGAEVLHFRIRKDAVLLILGGLAVLVLLMLVLVFTSGSLLRQAARARTATAENVELRRQLLRLNELESQLARIDATRKALLRIAGVEDNGSTSALENGVPADTTASSSFEWAEPESTLSAEELQEIKASIRRAPMSGPTSRVFGYKDSSGIVHTGMDLTAEIGTVVRAPGSGVVSLVGNDQTLGQVLMISHTPDLETLYGHNSRILVRPGDTVSEGQPIAEVGNTGLSSGPHLHFEIRWRGRSIDPASVISGLK
jgi:murein DD-endopeptidase MepM/ murein hydrolase activator NlpD